MTVRRTRFGAPPLIRLCRAKPDAMPYRQAAQGHCWFGPDVRQRTSPPLPSFGQVWCQQGFFTHGRVLLWKHLCHQLEIFKYANATTVKVCRIWVSKGLRRLEFAKAQQEACGAHILRFPNRICCHDCPHYECGCCRYQKNQYTAAAPADWPHFELP